MWTVGGEGRGEAAFRWQLAAGGGGGGGRPILAQSHAREKTQYTVESRSCVDITQTGSQRAPRIRNHAELAGARGSESPEYPQRTGLAAVISIMPVRIANLCRVFVKGRRSRI